MTIMRDELAEIPIEEYIKVGARLSIARESFRSALSNPDVTPYEAERSFEEFAGYLTILMFSREHPGSLASFDNDSIAQSLERQITCLGSTAIGIKRAEDIAPILEQYRQDETEFGLREMTVKALGEIVKPALPAVSSLAS